MLVLLTFLKNVRYKNATQSNCGKLLKPLILPIYSNMYAEPVRKYVKVMNVSSLWAIVKTQRIEMMIYFEWTIRSQAPF